MSISALARKLSAASFAFLFANVAHGALIAPGAGLLTLPGPAVGGSVLDSESFAFTTGGANGYSGTLTSIVWQNDPSNPNSAGGGLTFTYQLSNDATSVSSIEGIALSDFIDNNVRSTPIDVSYFKNAVTDQVPTETDRSGSGSVLTWDYVGQPAGLGALNPGSSSALLVVRTNSIGYDKTQSAGIIDNHVVQVPSIGPSFTIILPEPASIVSLALGGLVCMRRRVR